MQVTTAIEIARPIDEVWSLVADRFTEIQSWAASVIVSRPLEEAPATDAPMAGRFCQFTDDPNGFSARETITGYDRDNYRLDFEVVPVNAPKALPLKKNNVTITLRQVSPSQTEVRWTAVAELKAHGYLLYPMLKIGVTKQFHGLLEELKAYAEASDASAHAA